MVLAALEGVIAALALVGLLVFIYWTSGCDDARLTYVPLEEAGPVAEDGVRDREPLPEEPEPEPECELLLVWPADAGAPQGECEPGWVDTCTGWGAPARLPTHEDRDCDGHADGDCDDWAWITVVDVSGSMNTDGRRSAVELALCDLAADPRTRRALVGFDSAGAVVAAEWGDDLCQQLGIGAGAVEHGPAAAMEAPDLLGGWPPSRARGLTLISDEAPQHPGIGNGVAALRDWCTANDVTVDIAAPGELWPTWLPVVQRCGGRLRALSFATTPADVAGLPLPCARAP